MGFLFRLVPDSVCNAFVVSDEPLDDAQANRKFYETIRRTPPTIRRTNTGSFGSTPDMPMRGKSPALSRKQGWAALKDVHEKKKKANQ